MTSAPSDANPVSAACATLLVSDDPARVALAREILSGAGTQIRVQHVEHVADALELLRVCRFQALLLDLASLGGSRLDALDRIRLVGLRVPVVLLSDRDDPVEAQSALRGGAQDYLDLASEGPRRLPRALLYAVERHQLIADLLVSRHRAQLAATHDPLTQLPNRYLLLQQMERVLPQAARSGASAALLHVDLDRFKALNDALGRRAGDEVLAQVAARLARCTRRGDVVARVGGDEFLLLLTDIGGDSAPPPSRARSIRSSRRRSSSPDASTGSAPASASRSSRATATTRPR